MFHFDGDLVVNYYQVCGVAVMPLYLPDRENQCLWGSGFVGRLLRLYYKRVTPEWNVNLAVSQGVLTVYGVLVCVCWTSIRRT